jgi:hypothetical protein
MRYEFTLHGLDTESSHDENGELVQSEIDVLIKIINGIPITVDDEVTLKSMSGHVYASNVVNPPRTPFRLIQEKNEGE